MWSLDCQQCPHGSSLSPAGLAEREVLPGAAGEQVRGGGVCDGAADSHGKFTRGIPPPTVGGVY